MKNNSNAPRCKATNRKGKPCGSPPIEGSEYCYVHGLERSKAENTPHSKKWTVKRVISMVVVVVGLVSAIFGIWTVLDPKVSVQPGVALDPNKPAFTTFTIHNQGYVPVYDVRMANSIRYLGYPGNTHVIGLGDYTNRFSNPKHIASELSPDEQYSELLALSGLKNNNFENADIAIVLTYKWLWQRQSLHRFVSKQGKDGQWHWLPQPIKK